MNQNMKSKANLHDLGLLLVTILNSVGFLL